MLVHLLFACYLQRQTYMYIYICNSVKEATINIVNMMKNMMKKAKYKVSYYLKIQDARKGSKDLVCCVITKMNLGDT